MEEYNVGERVTTRFDTRMLVHAICVSVCVLACWWSTGCATSEPVPISPIATHYSDANKQVTITPRGTYYGDANIATDHGNTRPGTVLRLTPEKDTVYEVKRGESLSIPLLCKIASAPFTNNTFSIGYGYQVKGGKSHWGFAGCTGESWVQTSNDPTLYRTKVDVRVGEEILPSQSYLCVYISEGSMLAVFDASLDGNTRALSNILILTMRVVEK